MFLDVPRIQKHGRPRSNLSRSTMVFRLLRREARALLSCGEEWLVGGGSLHLGRATWQLELVAVPFFWMGKFLPEPMNGEIM